jgi:amino acid adenylation domain-containing protein
MFADSVHPGDFAKRDASSKLIPLSPIQRGLFADSFIAADKGVNVEQILCDFDEKFNSETMQRAWDVVIHEFDALRLQFERTPDGGVTQICPDDIDLPFRFLDFSDCNNQFAKQEVELFLEKDRRSGFDLISTVLLRVTLFHLPGEKSSLLWTIHHSIVDGHCFPVVIDRVLSTYQDMATGHVLNTVQQPSFLEFLSWIRDRDDSPGIEYFKGILKDFSEPTPLPLATSGRIASQRSKEVVAVIASENTKALLSAATAVDVSLNTVLQLAWGLLIGRYSGRDDVVFGATWSGRQGMPSHFAQTVGLMINTLPVRVDVSKGGQSVRDALIAVRAQHLGSRPFQHTSLARIKAEVGHSSMRHLFETIVVYEQEKPLAKLERKLTGNRQARFRNWSQTGYALSLNAHVREDELALQLEFDTGLYNAGQIERLLDSLKILICSIPDALDQDVHQLPILAPDLQNSLTILEVQREKTPPQPTVLAQIFAKAHQCPDSCAVIDFLGKSITYRELLSSAIQASDSLRHKGACEGDVIAILLPRSIEAIVAQLAVQLIKAVFLMLDQDYPKERLHYMLEDSGSQWMLVSSQTMDVLHHSDRRILNVEELWPSPLRDWNHFFPLSDEWQIEQASSERLAYIVYTSGSTGEPKGVCISEYSFAHHVATVRELYGLRESDRVLQFFAQSFDASLEEIFPTLAAGATLILRGELVSSSVHAFFETIETNQITVLNIPTAFWHQTVQLRERHDWPAHVRLLIVGGERISATVHNKFRTGASPHIRWLNCYGPTEATITSTSYDDCLNDHSSDYIPIGTPLSGHSHFVLDHRMRIVPHGVIGQLYIGGAGLAVGYFNRPEITNERFVPHPWRKGGRLYATGDLVWRTESGNHVYAGRIDHQVKLRGFRIELGEIEARLQQHLEVAEAVVVVQDRPGSSPRLVAFVESEAEITPNAIRNFAAATLPAYMVPAHVVICKILPTTAAGKIDRKALESLEVNSLPVDQHSLRGDDKIELELIQIWNDILETNIDDKCKNFFESGGNSMLALNLFAEIERRFQKIVNPSHFFKHPTLAQLANMIRQAEAAEKNSLIVRLAAGSQNIRPLFLTPGLAGRGIDYVHLSHSINSDVPLYAICMPTPENASADYADARTLASMFADEIQAVQPEGPYALAGFSAGCIVAIAISEILLERGAQVDFVGLIDGTPPSAIRFPSPFSSPRRLVRLARTIVDRIRDILKHPGSIQALWSRSRFAMRRVASTNNFSSNKYELNIEDLFGGSIQVTEIDREVMQSRLSALMAYDPQPISVDISLFRVASDPFEGPHEPDLGWSRLVNGKISIEIIPGNHRDMLNVIGAPILAKRMNPHLEARNR